MNGTGRRGVAVVTVSDGVSRGVREDASGRAVAELLEGAGFDVKRRDVVPDERAQIEAESPLIAERVEDIAEDRSWLSHKLLNVRTIFSFVLAFGIIVFIFI